MIRGAYAPSLRALRVQTATFVSQAFAFLSFCHLHQVDQLFIAQIWVGLVSDVFVFPPMPGNKVLFFEGLGGGVSLNWL